MFTPITFKPYPWMEYAFKELGVREIRGRGSRKTNSQIAANLSTVGLKGYDDETPWCSAFVNWCMEQAGIHGTGKGNARSWLNWEEANQTLYVPKWGSVVIFWRISPYNWKGHVAFY